jgi:hypothetical protein
MQQTIMSFLYVLNRFVMNLVKANDYMDQTFKIKEALELGDNSIVSGIGS